MSTLLLPDRAHIFVSGETDPVHRHYQPVVGYFMNKRLRMVLELMGDRRFPRLLDAGYGGGVFFPELARRTDELHGVDVHPHQAEVGRMAAREGIRAELAQGSVTALPYPDAFFDAVTCVSVLEFVADVEAAVAEIRRVTRPGGAVFLAYPGENVITTLGYFIARTPDPRVVHKADHRRIVAAARRALVPGGLVRFPARAPAPLALFFAAEFTRS